MLPKSAKPAMRRSKCRTWYVSRLNISRSNAVFPTELAPTRTVKFGGPDSARSMARISVGRGKNPGNGAKVCVVRSWERSRVS